MAIGAITLTLVHPKKGADNVAVYRASFAGDGDYHTNGTPAFEAAVQAKAGKALTILAATPSKLTAGYTPIYDRANDKLVVVDKDTAEVANHGDLSAVTFELTLLCA